MIIFTPNIYNKYNFKIKNIFFFKGFLRVVVDVSFSVIPFRVNLFKPLYITSSAVERLRGLHAMESHIYTLYIYIYLYISPLLLYTLIYLYFL